jgi:RNA polymerase sigma factor (sigma-70 family)
MMKKEMQVAGHNDAELVAKSLAGNQEAFRQIVERHQTLVCSLAYCATGSVSQSEDLAQETFITAWKDLAELREPSKLRSWLCAILRFLISKQFRRQDREPAHAAEPMEAMDQSAAREPLPSDQAITNDEQAILWRSLERIPEIYREPLVLFYREHQSIQAVAHNLELSEDAVKQRLSRGRKMLQEQVLAFVESALERTQPGPVFTLAVLAALPSMTLPAKAATLGAAAAKGGAAVKGTVLMGLLGSVLTPLLAFFGMWKSYRREYNAARSDGERAFYKSYYRRFIGCIVGFILTCFLLMSFGKALIKTNPALFASLVIGGILAYPLVLAGFFIWRHRARKQFPAELPPAESATGPKHSGWEYRSRFQLLGLPFIHIRTGGWQCGPMTARKPVKAWIAADDAFAYGAVAVAPISIGACAIGLFSYGAMAVGVLAVGGFGFGVWAFGGFAFGWQASGGCAIAWNIASGANYAIAHYYANGATAQAAQTNNEFVRHLVQSNPFFQGCWMILPYFFWLMWGWAVPLMISMVFQWRVRANRRQLEH